MERDVCNAVEELNMRMRELSFCDPRSHTPHLPLQVEELVALAATAGRLPAHTFAEAVKAAYDCCAAPLKVLRAGTMGRVSDTGRLTHAQPLSSHPAPPPSPGGTAAANASVIDVAADASALTPRSSQIRAVP